MIINNRYISCYFASFNYSLTQMVSLSAVLTFYFFNIRNEKVSVSISHYILFSSELVESYVS